MSYNAVNNAFHQRYNYVNSKRLMAQGNKQVYKDESTTKRDGRVSDN